MYAWMLSTRKPLITISPYLKRSILDLHKLADHAAEIYNADESGMPLDFKTANVVAETGSEKFNISNMKVVRKATIVTSTPSECVYRIWSLEFDKNHSGSE